MSDKIQYWINQDGEQTGPLTLDQLEIGKSYELIYLVKMLTERANYRKMKSFFIGPKWVSNRDSSYVRGADYHLKETLHKLYPTLPDQL